MQLVPTCKIWTTSGEALSGKLARDFFCSIPKAMLLNLYGSTEVAADVTCHELRSIDDIPSGVNIIPIGKPIRKSAVSILDPQTLKSCPVGTTGELFISGSNLAREYWKRPEKTKAAFVWLEVNHEERRQDFSNPNALVKTNMRYFRSGDFGYQKVKGGPIYFVGRRDQQVKIRGHRVECMEVEVLFKSMPSVKNCAVIASDKLGNSVQLFLFCTTNGLSTTKEEHIVDGIYAWGQKNLPAYMIPARVIVLATLPTLPNGKLDRQSLRELVLKKGYNITSSTNSSTSKHPLKNRYEKYTLRLWGNVLGLKMRL